MLIIKLHTANKRAYILPGKHTYLGLTLRLQNFTLLCDNQIGYHALINVDIALIIVSYYCQPLC